MRSNLQNLSPGNLHEITINLNSIENTLKDLVRMSIDEVNDNPSKEKELISLWAGHAISISNFFFEQCEKTGNKELYKNIIKYMMFKR